MGSVDAKIDLNQEQRLETLMDCIGRQLQARNFASLRYSSGEGRLNHLSKHIAPYGLMVARLRLNASWMRPKAVETDCNRLVYEITEKVARSNHEHPDYTMPWVAQTMSDKATADIEIFITKPLSEQ